MKIEELQDKLFNQFTELDPQLGYIVYVFDNSENGQGTGFHRNADMGDALVAIKRIAEKFGIDLSRLA